MEHIVLEEMAAVSKLLQVTMLDEQAFVKAVEQGYIVPGHDGHLQWMLGKTLLVYFCGKMWCGDRGRYSRRRGGMLWVTGKKGFPGQALADLFDVRLLRQTRNKRKNMLLPRNFELIDFLFV